MLDCWSWALELNMTIPCDWQYQIEQQEEACFVEPWHPPQHFFIILQCSFPCTGYEYRYKIIRYPSHKAWVIPDKHWRKNWVWSVEKSHHHPMSHPATLRGIWRVPIMMTNSTAQSWSLILMCDDMYYDENEATLHIFLVVSSPHSLEGRICRPECSKEQPRL